MGIVNLSLPGVRDMNHTCAFSPRHFPEVALFSCFVAANLKRAVVGLGAAGGAKALLVLPF
jgi:hypothetical protein